MILPVFACYIATFVNVAIMWSHQTVAESSCKHEGSMQWTFAFVSGHFERQWRGMCSYCAELH